MNNTDMTAGQGITEKTDAAGETTPDNKRRGDQAEAGRTRIRTLRKGDNKPRILILKRRRGGVFQSNQSPLFVCRGCREGPPQLSCTPRWLQ